MKYLDRRGFTLVELLLAMAFFSFILLFATTGFIIVNRSYNKGLTVKLVQDEARSTMERFSREIRSVSSAGIRFPTDPSEPPTGTPLDSCITLDGNSYYWTDRINSSDAQSPKSLLWVEGVTCANIVDSGDPAIASGLPAGASAVSILNDRVGVQSFEIVKISNSQVSIGLVLSTTETDLLGVDAVTGELTCSTIAGSQYCDLVELNTVVSTR